MLCLGLSCWLGCSTTQYVKLRHVPANVLGDSLAWASIKKPFEPTPRSLQVLRANDLVDELKADPHQLLTDLHRTIEQDPSAEKIYAYAELSYRAGQASAAKDPRAALDYFGSAVAYAYLYLFDDNLAALRNPYDPQFRGACDLYNASLESALRIVLKTQPLKPGSVLSIETATQKIDVTVMLRCSRWHAEDFDRVEFSNDYEVQGLTNINHTYGLGVPLIALQKKHADSDAAEKYYPPGLSFPVTAFLRLLPDEEDAALPAGHRHRAVLELHDPLGSTDTRVGPRLVPLETDLSTPLAYFLQTASKSNGTDMTVSLEQIATLGLLRPDKSQAIRGLYMLQPYEPEKIPVVLVHGLWSSPLTWTEMFNDLCGDRDIRARFQFWFYLYPTGQPFWTSAAQFREDLAALRATLDPSQQEPALDQMVLIGHSMGGLVSRLQTIFSHNDIWQLCSDQSLESLKASQAVKDKIRAMSYFEPNPAVKRIVTIGTPHRGSKFASDTVRFVSQKVIHLPDMMFKEQIIRDNPGAFKETCLLNYRTSIDSLAPESPIFPVLLTAERGSWVTYHNIVGVAPQQSLLGKVAQEGDGVVSYESAHIDEAVSELVVPADHVDVHRHPRSILEVRRILREHLATLGVSPLPTPSLVEASHAAGSPRPALVAPKTKSSILTTSATATLPDIVD